MSVLLSNRTLTRRGVTAGVLLLGAAGTGPFLAYLDGVSGDRVALAAAISAALALAAAWLFITPIKTSARALSQAMHRMAADDRTIPLPGIDSRGDIGTIAKACAACRDSVAEASRLRDANDRLKVQAESDRRRLMLGNLHGVVGAGIKSSEAVIRLGHMGVEVTDTNARMQTMAASVEELLTSVREISANSESAASESKLAENAMTEGVQSSRGAVRSMQTIFESVNGAAQDVNELATASEKIGEIVTQINAIAGQTNLLALNATIEAARAGEAGRGFAVVASEVKTLATQASGAADDIAERITDLRARMEAIVGSMRQGADAVADGRRVIDDLGSHLEEVANRIGSVTLRMSEIAGILGQQDAAAGNMATGITSVAEMSDNNANAIQRLLSDLDALATGLDEQIGGYADLGGAAIVEIAKNDHIAFKRRIVNAVLERGSLRPEQLANHHNCRLGKWYDAVRDPALTESAAFKALARPHQRVHEIGHDILARFCSGDVRGAIEDLDQLDRASSDVLAILDRLASETGDADASAS